MLALSVPCMLAPSGRAEQVDSTWVGPLFGTWHIPSNWSPMGIPTNAGGTTYHAIVRQNSSVEVSQNVVIDRLTIGPTAKVTLTDGQSLLPPIVFELGAGPLVNDGKFVLAGGESTQMLVLADSIAFEGNGIVDLGCVTPGTLTATNFIELLHASTHTISGCGSIGLTGWPMRIINHGTIDASGPFPLVLKGTGVAPANVNSGTMRASSNTLRITQTLLNNADGAIVAQDRMRVELEATHLANGFLQSEGAGAIVVVTDSHLTNVAHTGSMIVAAGADLTLEGTLTNNGSVSLSPEGETTRVLADDAKLIGSGELDLGTSGLGVVDVINFSSLTNGPDHLIRGTGVIDPNVVTTLLNHGEIRAEGGQLMVRGFATNSGLLSAVNGTLRLDNIQLNNYQGTLRALDGGTLLIANSTVNGGILEADEGSTIFWGGICHSKNWTSLSDSIIGQGGHLRATGTVTNLGEMFVSGGTTRSGFHPNGPLTLLGKGSIVMNAMNSTVIDGIGPFTQGADHTIRGSGKITITQGFFNLGLVHLDTAPGMIIGLGTPVVNGGVITVDPGNILELQLGSIANSGLIDVPQGSSLAGPQLFVMTDGILRVDGSFQSLETFTDGGRLEGCGTLTTSLVNSNATIAPTARGIPMKVTGTVAQTGGIMEFDILGPPESNQFSQLSIGSLLVIGGGTLEVSRGAGVPVRAGDEFTIITAPLIAGAFASVKSCDPVQIIYTGTQVRVRFLRGASGMLGDLNDDAMVDGADLAALLGTWGEVGGNCTVADINGDGIVDGADLAILLGHWQ